MTATGAATRPPPPTTDVASSSFDIFLLVQTWYPYLCCAKPENCVLKPDSGANLLAIHGLWPSRSTGGFPTYCSLPNPRPKLSSDVSRLSRHEWKKHGTCSSMSPSAYFSATASSAPPPPPLLLEATNGGKIAAVLKTDELRGAYPKKVAIKTDRRCRLAEITSCYARSSSLLLGSTGVGRQIDCPEAILHFRDTTCKNIK
eukprot:CAMPEP_0197570982 /NCGR_PEP_ID=MMETSP1320-20131121/41645_1 /TAXON_ID=91990 /ORGANISM="Bolidomonas sp., Strain RCC2347" /LENGTH=200 /DNA_ID=CAMNT_0043133455 /DNA_START=362 /DNA_END=961 /DNA_ORIENTATION=+